MINFLLRFIIIVITTSYSASGLRRCTKKHDLQHKYAECDPQTNLTTVHFYYAKDCDDIEVVDDDKEGAIIKNGSEFFTTYIPDIQCNHRCPEDGYYSTIQYFPNMK